MTRFLQFMTAFIGGFSAVATIICLLNAADAQESFLYWVLGTFISLFLSIVAFLASNELEILAGHERIVKLFNQNP